MSLNTPRLLIFSDLDGTLLDQEFFPDPLLGTFLADFEGHWKFSLTASYPKRGSSLGNTGKYWAGQFVVFLT